MASVYRYERRLTSLASGFTMIGRHRLRPVRSPARAGDGSSRSGRQPILPTPGALIRVNADGTPDLASTGLEFPAGIAVAKDGSIYLTNWSVLQGSRRSQRPPA